MPRPARSYRATVAVAALASALTLATWVGGAGFGDGATATQSADRVLTPVGDLVAVFDIGEVDADVVAAARRVAAAAGGSSTTARTGSLGLTSITRAGAVVYGPPAGWLVPMVYLAVPEAPIGRVTSPEVAAMLDADTAVMNAVTAELTGARVGDIVHMRAANGSPVSFRIAGIAGPDAVGSAELVFTDAIARRLGATEDTRVIIHDADRGRLEAALAAEGLDGRRDTQVSRSWDPPDPDSSLSTMHTKVLLGEPVYRFNGDGSVSMHPAWVAASLPDERELLNDVIRIRARCNLAIVDDLRAALADVAAAGLAAEIEVANANTYGGCYGGARFSRLAGEIGFLSRHSYGQALDTNTVSNCQGCVPRMHCDVVRIFRRHGFAWGGNWRRPDGMHFEWVGEPRDGLAYDSNYCSNLIPRLTASSASAETGATILTAGGEHPVGHGGHDHG